MTPLVAVIRDVFRQARATGLTATIRIIIVAIAGFCATAQFTQYPTDANGKLTILFGSVSLIEGVNRSVAANYLQFLLAGIVADMLGVLLALVWTSGFLPTFLDAPAISVMLAKPPRRTALFLSRFTGVVLFVGFHALLFVTLTSLVLGSWTFSAYWLCLPLLLMQFTVFLAFTALLAVMTRNTAGCLIGTILFWLVCMAMNYGRHVLVGLEASDMSAALVRTADIGYWIFPKPADFGLILYDALDADRFATPLVDLRRLQERGLFSPIWSVISSLAFATVVLGVAVYEFVHDDY
jgi:hypothetical protein